MNVRTPAALDFSSYLRVENLPCPGCRQVSTIMGSLCDPCRAAEQERSRRRRVESDVRALRKRFAAAPRIGTPEFARRVTHPKLAAFAARYSYDRGNALVTGPTGCGKTQQLPALALRLADEAVAGADGAAPILRACFTTGPRLARALRESRLGTTCEALTDARDARLLFLDEIGQESADPRWLLELLHDRYAAGGLTITTSGLTRDELEKRYGSGAVRRLLEPVGVLVDAFGGAT